MSPLPPDTVIEILLYLPVKSLKRFRSLSKTFCNEIDSSYFIQFHLKKSIQRKIRLKLIIEINKFYSPYVSEFDHGLLKGNFLDSFPFLPSNRRIFPSSKVKGSCNGLLLIAINTNVLDPNRDWEFCIWNPFIKQYKNLSSIPCKFSAIEGSACGFGYDSVRDDYKIVILSKFPREDKRFRVWVFSLRSNSWRIIQDLYLKHPYIVNDAVFVGNALYWQSNSHSDINWKSTTNSSEVFGFHLTDEMFFKLPMIHNPSSVLLEVLDDKLHLVKMNSECNEQEVYLWVSGARATKVGRWKKVFVLKEGWDFVTLLGSKKKEKVLFYAKDKEFYKYNILKRERETILVYEKSLSYTQIRTCWESLVSPNNYGEGLS